VKSKKNQNYPVITIDGASGTGKGVVTHRIAKELNWNLLDSGALYRVLALAAEKYHISLDNAPALTKAADQLDVQFITNELGIPPRIILEREDVTDIIRSEQIGNAASKVGALPAVREALLDRQRAFLQYPGLVTDGRDMGTVIFPEANLKVFLIASPNIRAERRYNQLKAIGIHVNLDALVSELSERDKRDSERLHAPLKPAANALCIDTDFLTIQEVVNQIMTEAKKFL